MSQLLTIRLDELHESPLNPRTHYDEVALKQLAESLQASGQITPITVRVSRNGRGGYEIAAGHRRRRAAMLAGLTHLEAKVRDDLTDDDAGFIEILNIENLQRDDLHPLEEAQGFRTLMEKAGYDIPKIAARIGKSVKYVYDRLKLLQLIKPAQQLFLDGRFEAGHAILLARLSPGDQERAIADNDQRFGRIGGLFQDEHVAEGLELELEEEPRKAVSVREFQGWIQENVRFKPDQVAQADLQFDFPNTAAKLTDAAENKLKVVKITREYRVPDEARDEKERTYGEQSWMRADGEPDRDDDKPSKTCDRSVVGLVVAGPGRGEAFLVCINKKKCAVHWPEQVKAEQRRATEAAKRESVAAKGNGKAAPAKAPKVDPTVLPDELRAKWVKEELEARVVKALVPEIKSVITEIKLSDEICWNLITGGDFNLYGWNKVGKRGGPSRWTRYRDDIEELALPHLPGKFSHDIRNPKDGAAARTAFAVEIWFARDLGNLDQVLDAAIESRWKAHRAAQVKAETAKASPTVQTSAKSPTKTKAKGKKLAGDVRRAKKRKAAR
jgi:ParB/RepB/Spo0J family partition protein